MIIFDNQNDLKLYLEINGVNKKIGFVPTMGALHDGHISLIIESTKKCELTICSIFINPTQFDSKEDLEKYPKTIEQDILLLKKNKCDILYSPNKSDLYKSGEKAKKYNFKSLESVLEGIYRPNHFNGVATIVDKLLNIVKADYAYFGLKDLQQTMIIKELVKLNKIKTRIIGLPTIREINGLAKSSRNKLLSVENKENASHIYKQLLIIKENFKQNSIDALLKNAKEKLINNNITIDYIEIVETNTFKISRNINSKKEYAICIAAYVNGVRLIDNLIL